MYPATMKQELFGQIKDFERKCKIKNKTEGRKNTNDARKSYLNKLKK